MPFYTLMKELSVLATEIRSELDEIDKHAEASDEHAKSALEHAVLCGEKLLEAKKLCKHGTWAAWLTANFDKSQRRAQLYMAFAELEVSKTTRASHLKSIRDATRYIEELREEKRQEKARKEREQKTEEDMIRRAKKEAFNEAPPKQQETKPSEEEEKERRQREEAAYRRTTDPNRVSLKEALEYLGVKPPRWDALEILLRVAAQRAHPDKGGTPEEFQKVQYVKSVVELHYKR